MLPSISRDAIKTITTITATYIDARFYLQWDGGGAYMADGHYIGSQGQKGRRTLKYINQEAAQRALERGDVYTAQEYQEMTAIRTTRIRVRR